MVKKISMLLGIVVAIFVVIGSLWKYDQYKADASELKKANEQIQLKADAIELKKANEQILLVSARLDQKIINDNIRALQRQIWDTKISHRKFKEIFNDGKLIFSDFNGSYVDNGISIFN